MTQRTKMIIEHLEGGYSLAALARRYDVSRKTAYKWIERFDQEHWAGLEDRSRAPHHQAEAVSEKIEAHILALKKRWPLWGAPKLHHKLRALVGEARCPCESTVSNILRRHGLSKRAKPRRVRATVAPLTYGSVPNQTWCVDFKGWWRTRDGERCDPLTITDASSRYLLRVQGLRGSTAREMVQPVFVAVFREFGLPEAIRTDNGPPFASSGLCGLSKLSVWWLKQGIKLDLIDPGHPEQNGRHERMHRTLKESIGEPARNLRAQQVILDEFRRHYNEERPHEALGFEVPAACYEPSPRQWSEKLPESMEYHPDWPTRSVRPSGHVKWKNKELRISDALVGDRIGFKPTDEGQWEIYFGTMCLGRLDERKKPWRLQPLRKLKEGNTVPPAGGDIFGCLGSSPSLRSAPIPGTPK